MKPKLLLHACCGTCSALLPERLSKDYQVDLFYFNPNIHPISEYQTRLAGARISAAKQGVGLIEDRYDPQEWLAAIKGLESEPEMGKRCPTCFEVRLYRTAKYAKEHQYDLFSTTLSVGRNKKAEVINPIGKRVSKIIQIPFLAGNFKKDFGLDWSVDRAKEWGIARQDYCGCVFSRKESMVRRQKSVE
ncbi:epoxyqueuosine reductase QueH [Patescibacteria group bacterium]